MRNETHARYVDLGLLVLRLGAGGLLLMHGWGKVTDLVSGEPQFVDPIGIGPLPSLVLAAFAEFVCALLVTIGLKVRWTAIPVVFNMAVAAFVAHGDDPFGEGELALMYLVSFLALALTGAGRYSFDGWWKRRRRR